MALPRSRPMTLKDLLIQLSTLAEEHPDSEVAFVTMDQEFGVFSAEHERASDRVLIFSDEPE